MLREEVIAALHYTVGAIDDIPAAKVEITNTTLNPVNTKEVTTV